MIRKIFPLNIYVIFQKKRNLWAVFLAFMKDFLNLSPIYSSIGLFPW